jgi:hypothetical protein
VKVFQVVRRGSTWHVHVPDAGPGVYPSEDKEQMVAWACDAARRVAGEVQVRDRGGQVETVYSYSDSSPEHDLPYRPQEAGHS